LQPPFKYGANVQKHLEPRGTLWVIIYGQLDFYDAVDRYCQDLNIFLQDPIGCDRVVEYRNPHRLSSLDEDVVMTSIADTLTDTICEFTAGSMDILEGFENGQDLAEAQSPPALNKPLYG
jgi:SWI/SNF-related matrix-associated actin-dependent regulator of chromatin subfamily A3